RRKIANSAVATAEDRPPHPPEKQVFTDEYIIGCASERGSIESSGHQKVGGLNRAPSTSLRISPAGPDARKAAQLVEAGPGMLPFAASTFRLLEPPARAAFARDGVAEEA